MGKNMNNYRLRILSAILFSTLIISSCADKGKQATPPPPPASVTIYKVAEENVKGVDTYPATVVALNEVELRAEVNGYITNIFVKDGQTVTKGQKLYEIDRSRYQANYQQAAAQVKTAQANLTRTQKDAERYQKLAEKDAIAKQRVDYAMADLQTAEAQLASVQAALQNAATDLAHSVIVAPFTGTIGIANVKKGSLVSVGSTLINTISSTDPIAVEFAVNEQDIMLFSNLQHTGKAGDSTFTLQLPDQSIYTLPGQISTIDRAVDPNTGTIKVRVSFPNGLGTLRAGMSTLVRVLNVDTGKKLTVPHKAITEQLGEFYVYVINDSSKVNQRKVKLGSKAGDKIIIREGLQAGDTIVLDGVQNLKEGSAVQVTAAADTTATKPPTAAK
jgi:membrane fusion protein (multidrug efflux system)